MDLDRFRIFGFGRDDEEEYWSRRWRKRTNVLLVSASLVPVAVAGAYLPRERPDASKTKQEASPLDYTARQMPDVSLGHATGPMPPAA